MFHFAPDGITKGRNYAMYVRMEAQVLPPGMQYTDGSALYRIMFFKQMRCIAVTQGMKVNFLGNGSIFPGFMHNPAKTFKAVTAVGFLTIEEIRIRLFPYL